MDSDVMTIALLAFTACAMLLIMRTGRKAKSRAEEKTASRAREIFQEYGELEMLGNVVLQGGLPQRPSSGRIYCALQESKPQGLVLYDDNGCDALITPESWREVDSFVLRRVSKSPFKSVFLLGPFVTLFFKDSFRYIVSLGYIDRDSEENNLILEAGNPMEHRAIAAALRERYEDFSSQKRVLTRKNFQKT